jgi:hypothetical protein
MFDVIYQFLISLVAKILSWFGVSLGQTSEKASEESASASASAAAAASNSASDVPPSLLPSGPVASDLSTSFSSQAAVVA